VSERIPDRKFRELAARAMFPGISEQSMLWGLYVMGGKEDSSTVNTVALALEEMERATREACKREFGGADTQLPPPPKPPAPWKPEPGDQVRVKRGHLVGARGRIRSLNQAAAAATVELAPSALVPGGSVDGFMLRDLEPVEA
jgi:hypothetical protein